MNPEKEADFLEKYIGELFNYVDGTNGKVYFDLCLK